MSSINCQLTNNMRKTTTRTMMTKAGAARDNDYVSIASTITTRDSRMHNHHHHRRNEPI
ncbi:MAG: hypothetical protein ACJ70Q_03910 [Nitrososphaera sp.]